MMPPNPDKLSNDGFVGYYDASHEYFDAYGKRYMSATTLIKEMYPFNGVEIAEKVRTYRGSRYFGMSVEDILKQWEETGPAGTGLHNGIEHFIKTGEIAGDDSVGVEFFSKGRFKGRLVAEEIAYDKKLMLAGQVDITEVFDDRIVIWDIKTSRKIPEDKLLKYSLQLEMYARWQSKHYGLPSSVGGIVWYENYVENRGVKPKVLRAVPCDNEFDDLMSLRRNLITMESFDA